MESALYMDDSYLKEFEATVESVKDDKFVVLDKTAFYPNGGGQPFDTGVLIKDGEEFHVISVRKADRQITHEVSKSGLKEGDGVTGKINWERRYRFMKMHTAAHLLSAVMHTQDKVLITGMVKLAGTLPPNVTTLRIVEIPGVDMQADGGTHVNSLKEIGKVEFVKAENKGKDNRRVYYTVS